MHLVMCYYIHPKIGYFAIPIQHNISQSTFDKVKGGKSQKGRLAENLISSANCTAIW